MGVENLNIITINFDQSTVPTELSEQQELNEDNAWDILKDCLNNKIESLYNSNKNLKIWDITQEIYNYLQVEYSIEFRELINDYVEYYCLKNLGIS